MQDSKETLAFELAEDPPERVKVYGVIYELRAPGLAEMIRIQELSETNPAALLVEASEFLKRAGMPSEVVDKMKVEHATDLVKFLCREKKT